MPKQWRILLKKPSIYIRFVWFYQVSLKICILSSFAHLFEWDNWDLLYKIDRKEISSKASRKRSSKYMDLQTNLIILSNNMIIIIINQLGNIIYSKSVSKE